tara:strand:- start:1102 stop:1716 length:615 start_codon:yes stop_codon:yes gene_type:complete
MSDYLIQAHKVLTQGKCLCFPTETVYGLGAIATMDEAVKRVYEIKERPLDKPLSMMVADVDKAHNIAILNKAAVVLAQRFWPGPLTMILPISKEGKQNLSKYVNYDGDSIGIRIPSHPVAQAILHVIDIPLIATSANPSGKPPALSSVQVEAYFKDQMLIVPESEDGAIGVSSTVIDVTTRHVSMVREGNITMESIDHCIRWLQ